AGAGQDAERVAAPVDLAAYEAGCPGAGEQRVLDGRGDHRRERDATAAQELERGAVVDQLERGGDAEAAQGQRRRVGGGANGGHHGRVEQRLGGVHGRADRLTVDDAPALVAGVEVARGAAT